MCIPTNVYSFERIIVFSVGRSIAVSFFFSVSFISIISRSLCVFKASFGLLISFSNVFLSFFFSSASSSSSTPSSFLLPLSTRTHRFHLVFPIVPIYIAERSSVLKEKNCHFSSFDHNANGCRNAGNKKKSLTKISCFFFFSLSLSLSLLCSKQSEETSN